MPLSPDAAKARLAAVLDRLVPGDADPSATGFGADRYVIAQLERDAKGDAAEVWRGLDALDDAAQEQFGCAFAGLAAADQDGLLGAVASEPWLSSLAELTAEGVYADPGNGGNRDAASWRMIGYDHRLPEGPSGPPEMTVDPAARWHGGAAGLTDYDVIVVGAGAGGGVAACVLAEAGKRVLLIERGAERNYRNSGHRDHLRNHRLALYGHNTGPALDGHPRVFVDAAGGEHNVQPHQSDYGNIASGVGSGTLLYGGLAWRFHPDDFRMASRYGVPEGSSLADWPISYDDLAPWYDRAEWEIGVCGDGAGNRHEGPRSRDYPMPPVPQYAAAGVLKRGAEKLGLSTFTPPILINTQARDGRGSCIECGSCVGFPCPSDAKNGTQNTVIPRAIATGRCDLITGATVERIATSDNGRVEGVTMIEIGADGALTRRTVRAKAVVVSCSAIETARLLLLSASVSEPDGLGNNHDLVGRNLQGHFYPTAYGLFDEAVHVSTGPGVTIATCDFNHGNQGVIGGAMLADDFVMPPVIFWRQAVPPDLQRWGKSAKDFMRDNFRHVTQVKGPVQEIPDPTCRVRLDPTVRDRFGLPVARLSGIAHKETMRTAGFMLEKAHGWLTAAGAKQTWGGMPRRRLSGGQHQAGTCRMGDDPSNSVTDAFGRVWGHDNLFVADGSLHPTNGGFNPVLTIMAMALRNADHIARSI